MELLVAELALQALRLVHLDLAEVPFGLPFFFDLDAQQTTPLSAVGERGCGRGAVR